MSYFPEELLIHSIGYQAYEGHTTDGAFRNAEYSEAIVNIRNVRVEHQGTLFEQDNYNRLNNVRAVCFVSTAHSTPLPEKFVPQSKVTFKGQDFTIETVVPICYPYTDKIHHYELELI